jgi:hypothetical protein
MTSGDQAAESSNWTIQSELCKITDKASLADALTTLGVIAPGESNFRLTGGQNWSRWGSETYCCEFAVQRINRPPTRLLLKACVAYSPNATLDQVLAEWVGRRSLLAQRGVTTPRLYFAGQGILLEDFVPQSFWSTLAEVREARRAALLQELCNYIGALSQLGFRPVDAFSDLRSNGTDLVAIDFGEDLGPANLATPTPAAQHVQGALRIAAGRQIPLTEAEVLMHLRSDPGAPLRH